MAPWLPAATDRDFDGYMARLLREPRFCRFGLFINHIHEHPQFWFPVRELLAGLSPYLGVPSSSLNTDVFIGNYAKTTFGAHRDPLDNLLIMVRGQRTLRLWSHEAFCGAMGECDPGDTFQDYSRAMNASQEFVLQAGDILYWPADHWHVGEGDEQLSISFNIDFPVPDDDDRTPVVIERAIDRLVKAAGRQESVPTPARFGAESETAEQVPDVLQRIDRGIAQVRELVASVRFEQTVALEYLRWITAGGFQRVPDALDCGAVSSDAWLWVDPKHPLRAAEVHGQLVISACGHGVAVPSCDRLIGLIEELNGGEPRLAADLVRRFSDVGPTIPAPSAAAGDFAAAVTADAVLWLLTQLVRFRGAFVVDVRGHEDRARRAPIGAWPVVLMDELRATPDTLVDVVEEHGVAWIEGALELAYCDPLVELLRDLRAHAAPEELGSIHANKRRYDLPLPRSPIVTEISSALLARLRAPLQRLAGANPRLVELSTLTSLPGAKAQQEHPDSRYGDTTSARVWTIFVSLSDIEPRMGPLSVWPGTHRSRFFEHEELKREALSPEREVQLAVPRGAAIIMDSRTWHRGGANRSSTERPVLYFSFAEDGVLPKGPTYTIRSELAGRLRFDDLLPSS